MTTGNSISDTHICPSCKHEDIHCECGHDFDDDYNEEEITECPACKRTYDDADADFLICSKCGWNVTRIYL